MMTLDAACKDKRESNDIMSEVGSIIESFKHKSKNYFNPLSPP